MSLISRLANVARARLKRAIAAPTRRPATPMSDLATPPSDPAPAIESAASPPLHPKTRRL